MVPVKMFLNSHGNHIEISLDSISLQWIDFSWGSKSRFHDNDMVNTKKFHRTTIKISTCNP